MKRIPKTPVEFDYDLWTTEDGKCMVRVKLTGEVTEVDREVMKILRAEEKKLRRSFTGEASEDGKDGNETVLSLDALPDDDVKSAAWLQDTTDLEAEVMTEIMEKQFVSSLSDYQRKVYWCCLKRGMTCKDFAAKNGNSPQGVHQTITLIRNRAKNFFKNF